LDLRVPGNVEDVLLGVDGRNLAADLLQALDDADRRVPMPGVVRSRQTGRAGPEDRDVDDAVLAHAVKMLLAGLRHLGRGRSGDCRGARGAPLLAGQIAGQTEDHERVGPWRMPTAWTLPLIHASTI